MKIHKVMCVLPANTEHHDVAGLHQADIGVHDCECFELKDVSRVKDPSSYCKEDPSQPFLTSRCIVK